MKPLLKVSHLTVKFGETVAVDKLSLTLDRGKTRVLIGESGCGKSVTAMSILRILPEVASITSGEIILDGQDLLKQSEQAMCAIRGRKIGIIFQEPQTSLNPVMTVGDQIAESLRKHKKITKKAARAQVIKLLDEMGIASPSRRYDDYPHQFSGGMKQRVMIAMALACEPALLIADEPSTALDVTIQAQVLDLLLTLQKRRNMAILFITHDLAVAAKMADDISVMLKGQIVEDVSKDRFFTHPSHDYSQKLFARMPKNLSGELGLNKQKKPSKTLLAVNHLDVYFPIKTGLLKRVAGYVKAVSNVSLDLQQGKTTAIVGESGSGKTSLGKGILQLAPIYAGSVLYDGVDLTQLTQAKLRKKRADIQIIFQDPYAAMNPKMLVGNIIEEGMINQNEQYKTPEDRRARVENLLTEVGLDKSSLHRYPHEFSGGQRQRICIARALAASPKLIICDEPTSALDNVFQLQILKLLSDLQHKLGLTYLLITHNLAIVEHIADHVAVMYKGEIVEQGDPMQVLKRPKHAYTERLVSALLTY